MYYGIILLIIGIIAFVLGIGGSAKVRIGSLGGLIVSGGAGLILIVLGVLFLSWGI